MRVRVKKKSKRQPRASADIRNVEVQDADDPGKLHYSYDERARRNMRNVPVLGRNQRAVRDPACTLGRDEEVQREE